MTRKFTREELKQFDGKEGRAAYLGFKGKVYDVSKGATWEDGDHFGQHAAGMDLTEEIEMAPHEADVLSDFPVVGDLAD